VIGDKPSARKSKSAKDVLTAHPKVRLHFVPSYSSWLNQVALWVGKIDRDLIARRI
jgi:DDE superfamily endonuclease